MRERERERLGSKVHLRWASMWFCWAMQVSSWYDELSLEWWNCDNLLMETDTFFWRFSWTGFVDSEIGDHPSVPLSLPPSAAADCCCCCRCLHWDVQNLGSHKAPRRSEWLLTILLLIREEIQDSGCVLRLGQVQFHQEFNHEDKPFEGMVRGAWFALANETLRNRRILPLASLFLFVTSKSLFVSWWKFSTHRLTPLL